MICGIVASLPLFPSSFWSSPWGKITGTGTGRPGRRRPDRRDLPRLEVFPDHFHVIQEEDGHGTTPAVGSLPRCRRPRPRLPGGGSRGAMGRNRLKIIKVLFKTRARFKVSANAVLVRVRGVVRFLIVGFCGS